MAGYEYQNPNASQPTVNVSQNNEASCLMAGNNKNTKFEYQNLNASQPTPYQGPIHEEPGTFQPYRMASTFLSN